MMRRAAHQPRHKTSRFHLRRNCQQVTLGLHHRSQYSIHVLMVGLSIWRHHFEILLIPIQRVSSFTRIVTNLKNYEIELFP